MPERSSVLIQDRVTADESLIPGNATRQITDGDNDVGYWRKVGHRDLLQSRDGLDASGGRRRTLVSRRRGGKTVAGGQGPRPARMSVYALGWRVRRRAAPISRPAR